MIYMCMVKRRITLNLEKKTPLQNWTFIGENM